MIAAPLEPDVIPDLGRFVLSEPLTVAPEASLEDAIAHMLQAQTRYVLVTEQQRPIGIFTERDWVRLIASEQPTAGVVMAAVMRREMNTLTVSEARDAFAIFHLMRQQQADYFPVVDENKRLVGIVTRHSLKPALTASNLLKLRRVEAVMESQVACAPQAASVLQVAQQMAERYVSYVVITEPSDRAVGVITERDIIRFQTLGVDIYQTQAQTVMSTPLLPIHPQDSLWAAQQQMNTHHVQRLVVCTPEGKPAGLITQSSILQAFDPTEIQEVVEPLLLEVMQLRSENQALLEARNRQLVQEKFGLRQQQLQTEQIERQQSEAQIRFQTGLLNAVAHAVIATDLSGQILYWNRSAETLYGWTAAEVMERPIGKIIPTHTPRAQAAEMMSHLQRGEQWSGEVFVQRRDGTAFPVWMSNSPLCNDQGNCVGMVRVSIDMSDRKRLESERQQAEAELQGAYVQLEQNHSDLETTHAELSITLEELQAAEHHLLEKALALEQAREQAEHERLRYQDLFDNAPDGYLITDMAGNIQEANQTAATLLCPQQSSSYLTGLPFRLFISQQQLPFFRARLSQLRRPDPVHNFEVSLRPSKQTETFPAAVTIGNIPDSQGQPIGLRWLIRDISRLKQAEQALQQINQALENQVEVRTADLRQAEQRWRTLLENVQLAVVGINDDGKVTYANPFFLSLTGYRAAEVLGEDWFTRFVPQSQQSALRAYFQQLFSQPDPPLQSHHAVLTRSGSERIIAWNHTLLQNAQDSITGTMSIGEDITESMAMDRMKEEFISVVSHELRTPLTAIHGGLQLVSQGVVPSQSESGQQLLQLAAKNSQRLVRLVNDILELERLESDQSPLQKQTLNTRDLTRQVIDSFQLIAIQAGITLEVSDPGLELIADGDCLIQVLTNLLDNAIKYSPSDTTVWLTVEPGEIGAGSIKSDGAGQGEAAVLFKVRDQGRGIPPEKCTAIFERFMQVDSSDSRLKGGTGLGLAICRNIVEQHGGSIWVESTPGEGSSFCFTLPVS